MNKEKTAMQMIIEELDKLGILVDSAKNVAEQLLQKEQEQIEQAFDDGQDYYKSYMDDREYYKSKYGGEK